MNAPAAPKKLSIFALIRETVREWSEDNALRLSAALAYYSLFSIAPLIVIATAVVGRFLGDEAAKGLLDDQLQGLLGPTAAEGVQSMAQGADKKSTSAIAGIIGTITLIFGASGVFAQLKDALNTIWEVRPKPGQGVLKFLRERLLSFGMVLVIGFLLLVSLMMTTALSGMDKYLGSWLPFSETVLALLASGVSFAMITVLFGAIFKILPDAMIRWRDVWIGALVTAVLFEIGKFALGFYLGRESTASTYGAAASVVLVVLWVYYASLILFFGAEFTQVWAKAHGRRIEPSPNAEAVTAQTRAQQGLKAGSKAASGGAKPNRTPTEPLRVRVPQRRLRDPHRPVVPLNFESDAPPLRRLLRAYPLTTMVAAAAGGSVLGFLVRRKLQ